MEHRARRCKPFVGNVLCDLSAGADRRGDRPRGGPLPPELSQICPQNPARPQTHASRWLAWFGCLVRGVPAAIPRCLARLAEVSELSVLRFGREIVATRVQRVQAGGARKGRRRASVVQESERVFNTRENPCWRTISRVYPSPVGARSPDRAPHGVTPCAKRPSVEASAGAGDPRRTPALCGAPWCRSQTVSRREGTPGAVQPQHGALPGKGRESTAQAT